MKVLKFDKFFEEASLNLQELDKLKDGQPRGNVLVNKLKTGQDLTTNNNQKVQITKMKSGPDWIDSDLAVTNITDDRGKYDSEKAKSYLSKGGRYSQVFKSDDNKEFKLNQFKKTKDFGSSGAGRLLREFESVQSIFLAIKQADPFRILTPVTLTNVFRKFIGQENVNQIVYLPQKINFDISLLDDFLEDENWLSTFCRIPNRLWSTGFINPNFQYKIFHAAYSGENSPYVALEKKYKEFAKQEEFKDINISKYCPADVYLSHSELNDSIIKSISKCTRISELTETLDKLFDEKLLLPLSLKKISMGDRFKIISNKEVGKELPEFFIYNLIAGTDLKGIGSKIQTYSEWKHKDGKDVDIKNRDITIDSSDTSKNQNVDAEVEGSSSRHGKISFNAIKRILTSTELDIRLDDYKELQKLSLSDLTTQVIDLTQQLKDYSEEAKFIKIIPIRGKDISNSEKKLISRLQSLQILLAIYKIYTNDKNLANSLITKMMRYALSIQTDKFDTPRYLRVI